MPLEPLNSSQIRSADVNRLFEDISEYNKQFSIGGIFASLLRGSGSFDGASPERALGEAKLEVLECAATISGKHGQLLRAIGLSIEPVLGKAGTIFTASSNTAGDPSESKLTGAKSGEIRLNVQDRASFIAYLTGLKPIELSQGTELRQNLEKIANNLTMQLANHYSLIHPSDEAIELLAGLNQVVEAYKKQGMTGCVERLGVYAEKLDRRCLAEYLAIETAGLMQEQGKGFGPADWPIDTTPEQLQRRWGRAIAVLDAVKPNASASELHRQAVQHLIECVDYAIENIGKTELTAKDSDGYRRVLSAAREALLERES